MNHTGRVKRFILFMYASPRERKEYVRSFKTKDEAIAEALVRKTDSGMRWQVIDNETSRIAAEDLGAAVVDIAAVDEEVARV
jgi:hypothetical protein